jgi:hypothetical protein
MCIARASARARAESGEDGTLVYMKAYRAEYGKIVEQDGMRGGAEYLAGLDKTIAKWENGQKPDDVIAGIF